MRLAFTPGFPSRKAGAEFTVSSLFGLLFLSGLFLTGCLKDRCTHSAEYKMYTPVYTSLQEIRNGITSGAPRALENTGKIFYHNGYLFLNELDRGVHVINDKDPAAPENAGFINIPGNIDLTVKGNILYADSYTDLVAIDISNPLDVKVTRRIQQVFPSRTYGYGFSDDPGKKGIITGFKVKDTLVDNDCDIHWANTGVYYDALADYALTPNAARASQPTVIPSKLLYTVNDSYLYHYGKEKKSNNQRRHFRAEKL